MTEEVIPNPPKGEDHNLFHTFIQKAKCSIETFREKWFEEQEHSNFDWVSEVFHLTDTREILQKMGSIERAFLKQHLEETFDQIETKVTPEQIFRLPTLIVTRPEDREQNQGPTHNSEINSYTLDVSELTRKALYQTSKLKRKEIQNSDTV